MYRFAKADFLRWLDVIGAFVQQGKVQCYAEDALNEIFSDIVCHPVYFDEFCMEVDTKADLERARKWLRGQQEVK